jgi:N-acetylglutamate synthase-like GNAT family acetyltransferase
MTIRPAENEDLPAIIALLKASLGESLLPKSEEFWRWKHISNPFGKSPVLLAEHEGQILGVRAFLKWEFVKNGKPIKACRAVDTATHPDFQGRGIFSKLTMGLIDEIQKEGIDLIFNTPNAKSSPGYLKMGWQSWGRLPLKLDFHLGRSGESIPPTVDWRALDPLIDRLESSKPQGSDLLTRLIPGYLRWRYEAIPLFPYQYISDGESYLLIYRIKEGKMGREFRICELLFTRELDKSKSKELKRALAERIKSSGARFSSISGLSYPKQKVLGMGLLPVIRIGPLVTLRQVSEDFQAHSQDWNWTLGDLEVF